MRGRCGEQRTHVTRHSSHVTRHTSHATHHEFAAKTMQPQKTRKMQLPSWRSKLQQRHQARTQQRQQHRQKQRQHQQQQEQQQQQQNKLGGRTHGPFNACTCRDSWHVAQGTHAMLTHTRYARRVTSHTSQVTRHTSHVTRHTSHLMHTSSKEEPGRSSCDRMI